MKMTRAVGVFRAPGLVYYPAVRGVYGAATA